MSYLLHLLVMVEIYTIVALSLNLIVGYAGLLSLAHAAFWGIGAYVSALLMVQLGLNFFVALALGAVTAGATSLLVAYPSLKLRGDYFVLASLAFQVIAFSAFYNLVPITRGPYGIPGIPRPRLGGIVVGTLPAYALMTSIAVTGIGVVLWRLYTSPFGRALKALRDDEVAALSLGKNIVKLKVWAFALGGSAAAISGGLYAGYVTYIDPTSFTVDESIFMLAIVLVGGGGNVWGPILGTLVMILLPEVLRFSGLPDTVAPNVRQIIYGLLLILVVRFRPQGLAGAYRIG